MTNKYENLKNKTKNNCMNDVILTCVLESIENNGYEINNNIYDTANNSIDNYYNHIDYLISEIISDVISDIN